MSKLEVHLQDGFSGDDVAAELDGRPVYYGRKVKTHPLLGLAAQFESERADSPGTLTVSVPNRRLSRTLALPAHAPEYVGVSIRNGQLVITASDRPFGYA